LEVTRPNIQVGSLQPAFAGKKGDDRIKKKKDSVGLGPRQGKKKEKQAKQAKGEKDVWGILALLKARERTSLKGQKYNRKKGPTRRTKKEEGTKRETP